MALFGRILRNEKRKNHRWVSGHLELGQRKEREREIVKKLMEFKQRMDRRGVVFQEDRDAWEAYWNENRRAHMDLVGASVDEVLGEKAYQVFKSFWTRINKPAIVRFEGDGVVAEAPTLLTIGTGDERMRADPLDLLKLTDPEMRALGANRLIRTIERRKKATATYERRTAYLERIVDGLETGATAITDPNTGEVIIQGLLTAGEAGDDDAE